MARTFMDVGDMRCSRCKVCCDQLDFSCSSRFMISSTLSAPKMRLISSRYGFNTNGSNDCNNNTTAAKVVL